MTNHTTRWTSDQIEQLKKLWSEGYSAAQIARAIGGLTRCSVIGKAHRLNLERRAPSPVPRLEPRKSPVRRKPGLAVVSAGAAPRAPVAALPAVIAPERRSPAASKPVGILEVTGCRWAVGYDESVPGKHLFCDGERKDGSSYCADHKPAPGATRMGLERAA